MSLGDEGVEELEDGRGAVGQLSYELLEVDDSVAVFIEDFVHHSYVVVCEVLVDEAFDDGLETLLSCSIPDL